MKPFSHRLPGPFGGGWLLLAKERLRNTRPGQHFAAGERLSGRRKLTLPLDRQHQALHVDNLAPLSKEHFYYLRSIFI